MVRLVLIFSFMVTSAWAEVVFADTHWQDCETYKDYLLDEETESIRLKAQRLKCQQFSQSASREDKEQIVRMLAELKAERTMRQHKFDQLTYEPNGADAQALRKARRELALAEQAWIDFSQTIDWESIAEANPAPMLNPELFPRPDGEWPDEKMYRDYNDWPDSRIWDLAKR